MKKKKDRERPKQTEKKKQRQSRKLIKEFSREKFL